MRRRKRNVPQPTSIRLPKELRKRLEQRATRQGSFLSVYIVWLLEQEMDRLDGAQQDSRSSTSDPLSGEGHGL